MSRKLLWGYLYSTVTRANFVVQRNLTLYNVTEKSSGLYLCTAKNEMVRIDVPSVLVVTGIVPSFRGTDSYLAFPTLLNTYLEFNIEVHFKPEMDDGT